MANWTPMDGSPGLKRQRAEHYGAAESNFSKLARKRLMKLVVARLTLSVLRNTVSVA